MATTSSAGRRLGPALIAAALALAPMAASAARVLLEEMTWTDVLDRLDAGATTVLVPVGGAEQNGPHIVLGKHNVRVHQLAAKIAERLGQRQAAPPRARG